MGYDDNDFRMISEMLHSNRRRTQYNRDSIWNLLREVWSMINNEKKRLRMELREYGQIWDTP